VVGASALPAEARRTLVLIDRGGPFPYERDGIVFGNVERLLPRHPRDWYREYTVPTPGESDRGARRIIVGEDGARYYTADHYGSFVRVDPDR
jgi:ribonuclease T1